MLIKSKNVWINEKFIPAVIEFDNTITNIYPYDKEADIDYGNNRIIPGMIDIHCHGAYDYDTCDSNKEGLRNWAQNIVKDGVTSFLATTVTNNEDVLLEALKNVNEVIKEGNDGAGILGVHLEGPYLSHKYKGAQPENYILKPDIDQFKRFMEASGNNIKIVTMAIENDEDFTLTDYLIKNSIVVSIGHSDATIDIAIKGKDRGVKSMTHVYNGMSPFNHRNNGLVGAALFLSDMYGEIIADLKHSSRQAVKIFMNAKDKDHAIMITDSLMIKGLEPGTRRIFAGQEITLDENGVAVLNNGTLAGSTLRMNLGLRNMIEKAEVDVVKAINSATINPARLLNVDNHKGCIETGKDADITVLADDYSVIETFVNGNIQINR